MSRTRPKKHVSGSTHHTVDQIAQQPRLIASMLSRRYGFARRDIVARTDAIGVTYTAGGAR